MDSVSLHQVLTVVSWGAVAVLLILLALIARKYEMLSGARTYFKLFALPVIAFAGAALRQVQRDQVAGDTAGDLFLLVGGVSLAALCLHMYRLMTSGD